MKLVVPIYCSGMKTIAYFASAAGKWRCHRCGANVKVVT